MTGTDTVSGQENYAPSMRGVGNSDLERHSSAASRKIRAAGTGGEAIPRKSELAV